MNYENIYMYVGISYTVSGQLVHVFQYHEVIRYISDMYVNVE